MTPLTEIRAVRGLVPLNLGELWEYRELVYFLLSREVKGRYRQMALGPLWIIISPLVNMAVFTVLFGVIAKLPSDNIPYPLFNYAGLLPWGFFSGGLMAAAGSLQGFKSLVSKVYFPRLVAPVVGVLGAFLDFAVSFVILLGLMAVYGFWPGLNAVFILFYLLLAGLCGLGVGLWVAPAAVHYRDVTNIVQYGVRFWMYATPVVYASSVVPERFKPFYYLNPMTHAIEGFRWALLGTARPPVGGTLLAFVGVTLLLVAGAYVFKRGERTIVDVA
jgi:lipopolysaccharide transport system permease protein